MFRRVMCQSVCSSLKHSYSTLSPSGPYAMRLAARKRVLEHCVQGRNQLIVKRYNIVDGGMGHYKPTPFQQKVLVWTKMYPSMDKVPDKITKGQMKKAMDMFRVRVSLGMVAMTFVFAIIMALVGRKERQQGQTMTRLSLARREQEK